MKIILKFQLYFVKGQDDTIDPLLISVATNAIQILN